MSNRIIFIVDYPGTTKELLGKTGEIGSKDAEEQHYEYVGIVFQGENLNSSSVQSAYYLKSAN